MAINFKIWKRTPAHTKKLMYIICSILYTRKPDAALDVLHHQRAERGSGHSGHCSVACAGMSAGAMRLQQSHDAACLSRKNAFIAFER